MEFLMARPPQPSVPWIARFTAAAFGALLLLSAAPLYSGSSLSGIPQATERIKAAAQASSVPYPFVNPEIRIFKEPHRLELWASGKKIKSYSVSLGQRGLGDKRISGDHLTPEGRYYVCTRSAQSSFHLFLGISYPSEVSAERGFRDGLISKRERDAILSANKRKACPPWNGPLGGTVGIHGGGTGSEWTWGCVALENSDVDELWAACPMGTPILIVP